MTVKDLEKLCGQAIANGDGDKTIYISNDDEGNGFHELIYAFTAGEDCAAYGFDPDKFIILG